MKRQVFNMCRWHSAGALALSFGMLIGCGKGSALSGAPLPPPVLSTTLPLLTHNPNLVLSGTRPVATDVVAVFANGTQATVCSDPTSASTPGVPTCSIKANNPNWSGSLVLGMGQNTFSLFAQRTTGTSATTSAFSVKLVDLSTPGLTNPLVAGQLFVYMNGQASISTPIAGTKSPDGDLSLTLGSNTSQVASIDNANNWSANVTVVHGANPVSLVSKDAAGDVSGTLSFSIVGTNQLGPTIDRGSYQDSTTQAAQTLTGTKPANSTLFFVLNGGTVVQVSSSSASIASTTWSKSFLLQEGANVASVYVVGTSDTLQSPAASALITLQSRVLPPVFNPPLISGQALPPTDANSIVLTGTLSGSGTFLCISHTPWDGQTQPAPPCFVTSNTVGPNGGTFTVTVPLSSAKALADNGLTGDGNNALYITARDNTGNVSREIDTSIYALSPPAVTNVSLANNSVVTTSNLNISFSAAPYGSDGAIGTAAQIASYQVCIDATCSGPLKPTPNQGGSFSFNANPNMVGAFPNGSSHTATITVTDGAGAQNVTTVNFIYSTGQALYLSADNGTPMHGARVPRSAFDASGNLHVVWEDDCANVISGCKVTLGTNQIAPDIFYVKRSPNGAWGPITLISADPADGTSTKPSIAVDAAGKVHIAWIESGGDAGKPTGQGIVHRVVNSGGTLSAIDLVGAPTSGVADVNPALAVDPAGSTVHISFTRKTTSTAFNIMYARLTGSSWSAPLQVTPTQTGRADFSAVAALPNSQAAVAWQDCVVPPPAGNGNSYCSGVYPNLNYDILLRTVTGPTTLDPNLVLVSDLVKTGGLDGDSRRPALVVDPNKQVWVFWDDTSSSQPQAQQQTGAVPNVWYRTYLNDACTSGGGYVLASGDPNVLSASQAAATLGADGTVAVVWSGAFTGGAAANVFGAAANFANALQPVVHLYTDAGRTDSPTVALDGVGNMHVVWQDESAPASNTPNPPTGTNFGAPYDLIFYQYIPKGH